MNPSTRPTDEAAGAAPGAPPVSPDGAPKRPAYADAEVAESAAMGADLLRSMAARWRARASGGAGPRSEGERLVDVLEAAARLVDAGVVAEEPALLEAASDSPHDRAAVLRDHLLVEGIPDYAIFMLDPQGRVVSWNLGAQRINQYTRAEILGRHFSVFYPPEDVAAGRPENELRTAARDGRYAEEGWRVRKDGSRYAASAVLTPLRDARGELIGFAKVTHDLTHRERAIEMLRQSEERFRLMVESVRDYAIFMLDPDGVITSWNAGATRLKGYAADEIIGKHFSVFYLPDDVAAGKPELDLAVAAAEGRHEEEGWRVRKDGVLFWANAVVSAVRDATGRHLGYVKVTRDFSERRLADEKLRQSEQTFRLLVESVRDYAIFMLDPDGVITSWNAGAARLKGYTADEIIGKHFSVFYTDADRRRAHPQDELVRATADGSYREEGWRVRKDGTTFWASVTITTVRDARGRHVGFAKVTRDMTERRRAEEALRKMNESLEAQVRQQVAATREVEAFSYSVSHDLRAPLRALDGFSRLLAEKASDRLDAEEKDYLRRIRDASSQMAGLIEAMLGLSRLTRATMKPRPVDVTALARDVVAEIRRAEPGREADVVIAEGLTATADLRLLRVALENLLRNAWKFSRKQPRARIEVGEVEAAGARAFFVRDNGAGLDMGQAHRLFIPFQRLHRAREFEGTGIGLATVNRIVRLHHGRIWVESEPGRGATFFFTLGAVDAAE